MAGREIQHVTIIGVGLLGGSLGLAVRRRYPGVRIAGVGRREISLDTARKVGCIDTAHLDARDAVAQSDLVVLATPVGAFEGYLKDIKPLLRHGVLVTDVGSTKARVVRAAERILGPGGPFVGSHPMAGNENKGPAYATADLFADALCIVTPTGKTPPAKVRRVERFWKDLGMRTMRMTPAAHDRAVARVSHLPHVLSGLLMLLPSDGDLDVAAAGLSDMTRLSGGDPEVWCDIMMTNRKAIIQSLDKLGSSMHHLRELLDAGDARGIERFFAKAKTRRDSTIAK